MGVKQGRYIRVALYLDFSGRKRGKLKKKKMQERKEKQARFSSKEDPK